MSGFLSSFLTPVCHLIGRLDDVSAFHQNGKPVKSSGGCDSPPVCACLKFWSETFGFHSLKPFPSTNISPDLSQPRRVPEPSLLVAIQGRGLVPAEQYSGDAELQSSVEILLELNRTKGQLYPDRHRKHNCVQLQNATDPTIWGCFLKSLNCDHQTTALSISCLSRVRFVYPVGGKEQLRQRLCVSLKTPCF